jgi:hypothetical protein
LIAAGVLLMWYSAALARNAIARKKMPPRMPVGALQFWYVSIGAVVVIAGLGLLFRN